MHGFGFDGYKHDNGCDSSLFPLQYPTRNWFDWIPFRSAPLQCGGESVAEICPS